MSKEEVSGPLDLPLITEATNEFYRQVYGDPHLYPIFKGFNMVVLRRHVSYFILQLTAFEEPITQRQIDYLRRAHAKVVEQCGVTQRHFDMIASLLVSSLRICGADGQQLLQLASKLRPVREIFPPHTAARQTSPTQAGQQHSQQQEPPSSSASDAALQQQQLSPQQQQQQQQPLLGALEGSSTAVQQGQQHIDQLLVQTDMQQCSEAPVGLHQECCCCSSRTAVRAHVATQQQQHDYNAVPAPAAPAPCKGIMHSNGTQQEQQQEQKQQQEGRPEKPRGLKKTQLWWKRLMTTVKSH